MRVFLTDSDESEKARDVSTAKLQREAQGERRQTTPVNHYTTGAFSCERVFDLNSWTFSGRTDIYGFKIGCAYERSRDHPVGRVMFSNAPST